MGFSSIDDLVDELTNQGKFWRQDFMKNTSGIGTVVAGRWYDLTMFPITGTAPWYIHGNYVFNADFLGGIAGWTLNGANWTWDAANHRASRAASADGLTLTQNTQCTNGVTYSVVFTLTRTAGSITPSLGGTNGTARSASGTYRENIVCGATANAPITFTPDATFAGTVDIVAITRDLAFTPYDDGLIASDAAIWHGGDVSANTKHLLNFGAMVNVAAGAPAVLLLVDLLGCYPRIRTDLATSQTLNNTLTLPRYTDGKGVRPFFVLNTANGLNAANFVMSYTNTVPTAGRGLGAVVSHTASAIVGHMSHSGVSAGNFGPFLPLMGGDQGLVSVQSCQFTVASASAGFVDLVLAKPLAYLPLTAAFYASERDLLNQLPSLPRIYDGAVLGVLCFCGAVMTACSYQGYIDVAWG